MVLGNKEKHKIDVILALNTENFVRFWGRPLAELKTTPHIPS